MIEIRASQTGSKVVRRIYETEKSMVLSRAIDKEQRQLAETILDDDYRRFRENSFVTLQPGEDVQFLNPKTKGCDYCGRSLKAGRDDCKGCGAPVMTDNRPRVLIQSAPMLITSHPNAYAGVTAI